MSRRIVKNVRFCLITLAVVLAASLAAVFTVYGSGRAEAAQEARYRSMEQGLLRDVRAFLEEAGCRDGGVTLTRVVDGQGNRAYTVTVHHRRIDRMEQGEREELLQQLEGFSFPAANCTFTYHFLLTE